jgi:8-amino-7-oxononanoate synthase
VIEYLKHHSRAFVYSASLAPANAAAVLRAIQIIEREPERRQRVMALGDQVRRELTRSGFRLIEGNTPIIPVVIGDEAMVCQFFLELLGDGIYTNPVLPPAVAHGLIRISCMATHTDEQAERLFESMHRIGKKLGII